MLSVLHIVEAGGTFVDIFGSDAARGFVTICGCVGIFLAGLS